MLIINTVFASHSRFGGGFAVRLLHNGLVDMALLILLIPPG